MIAVCYILQGYFPCYGTKWLLCVTFCKDIFLAVEQNDCCMVHSARMYSKSSVTNFIVYIGTYLMKVLNDISCLSLRPHETCQNGLPNTCISFAVIFAPTADFLSNSWLCLSCNRICPSVYIVCMFLYMSICLMCLISHVSACLICDFYVCSQNLSWV